MADTLTLVPIDLMRLAEPFPADAISWRVGATNSEKTKGLALAYIDARDVMDRLDAVCGIQGWQCEYTPMPNGTTCCRIGILIGSAWVWKANGAGATGDVNKETEREMAEKGGYSDALKRAAVLWGVGRYLYSLPSTWVAIESRGRSYVIKDSEYARLRVAAGGATPASSPPRQQRTINPETGREINPNSARQLNKNGAWESFKDRVQGFIDARDLDGLTLWFTSEEVAARVASWPSQWKDLANGAFEDACEDIERAGL